MQKNRLENRLPIVAVFKTQNFGYDPNDVDKRFSAECSIVSARVLLSGRAGSDKYLLGATLNLLDPVLEMTH